MMLVQKDMQLGLSSWDGGDVIKATRKGCTSVVSLAATRSGFGAYP